MIYTKEGSELLEKRFGEKFDDIPMILSGDFNINFADDKNLSLIEFLNETLGLTMSNDRKLSGYGHELVAGVSWARVLLPLKTRRVDEAIPPADVVVKKEGCQLRCPPRHST
ncbi:hypothetical protein TNCV_4345031 [Trichonephila clavipes]|nr:hypothetical protein TNCV_4345031 [Trichonephila clavipes]